MLNVLPDAQTGGEPAWAVRLEVQLPDDRREPVSDDELECMLELMMRTRGVRSAAATAGAGPALDVDLSLTASRADDAMERARSLIECCARYAGIGAIVLHAGLALPERASPDARGSTDA